MPSPNLMENPVKANKYRNYQKAKGMSSFVLAFLSSIVIYISIFHDIFSLSSSTLFSNAKFLFLISNTLILIIAADYGAFSSSKHRKRDLYEEYYFALYSQARRSSSTAGIPMEETGLKEKNEDVADQKKHEIPERILEVVHIHQPETDNSQAVNPRERPIKFDNYEICDQKIEPKTIRSKSDKVNRFIFNDKNNNLHRSKTKIHEPRVKQNEFPAEANEFSNMSDEELNRRVEEFIQKFNRQIRLQAGARNRQLLE